MPIGVIANAYPGSYISSWFPNTGIDPCNENRNGDSNERNWYNGRIYPIRNLKLSGIFWYQGESDSASTYHSPQYDYYMEMMPKLIKDWRKLFGDDKLPFYYVQLCRLGDTTDENNPDSTAKGEVFIRQAQTDTILNLEDADNIGMAGTLDLYGSYDYPQTANDGNCRNDIHPGQKRVIGERLANFALKDIYKKDVYTSGPMFQSAEVKEDKIVVTYDCNGQLCIMDSKQYADSVTDEKILKGEINPEILHEFEIAGADNVWHNAKAEITADNQVTVYSERVSKPEQVRYAYGAYPQAPNLTDASGLPSYVFKKTVKTGESGNPTEPTQSPQEKECVKITADYNEDGTLKGIKTEAVKISEIVPVENNALHKVFYWDSLEGMKPIDTQGDNPPVYDYSFNFGSGTPADGNTIQVCSDTIYGEQKNGMIYGMVGMNGALMEEDTRFDGFRYTPDGVISILKDGTSYVSTDYEAYDDEVKDKIGDAEIPVRFAMRGEKNGYYTVTATVTNTSEIEETEVSLYSETRHFILFHHRLGPGESITRSFNIHLAPTYVADNKGTREDDAINVCVTGKNAGLSNIQIKKLDTARTIYTMTDSTGADQLSQVPYWMLENYGGTGQVLSKYINPEIALSNQGEGGLDAGDSLHFNNAVANMKQGDFMYVQYGFNDASPAVYKRNLEKYYAACHEKGVKLIIVSPTDRRNTGANWDSANKVWTASNAGYAEAGKAFVDEKIAAGADDIAFVDVNTPFVAWMNEASKTIMNQRNQSGNPELQGTEVNPRAMEYYYRCGWTFGTDSVHINDAGADRAGYIFAEQARKIIDEAPDSVQARVLSELMENAPAALPYSVSDEIVAKDWAPNDSYPKPLSQTVEFPYPVMVKSVDTAGGKLNSMTVKVQGNMNKYAQGVGELLDTDGNLIKTVYTVSTSTNEAIGHIDNTASKYGDTVTMYFNDTENTIPDHGTYRVYLLPLENGAEQPDQEPMYSSIYTQPQGIIDKLITSADGTGSEMFGYPIDEGESIREQGANASSGAVKWQYAGSASSIKLNKETKNGMTSAHLYTNGTGTYALTKFFNGGKTVTDGVVHLHMQLNHTYGWYGIKLASTAKAGSWMDGIQIASVEDGALKLYDGTTVAGRLKSGSWTDVDVWIDLDRCTETVSVAGGEKVSCKIEKLDTSDKNEIASLIPLRGFTMIYTKYPSLSPSYAFDTYITDLSVNTVETNTPQIRVNAAVDPDCTEMGSISGAGSYNVHADVTLTASPNTGYNFIGWYTADNTLYSKEKALIIGRVCSDISLTAKFAVQRHKEDIVSFEIGTDKTAVRVGSLMSLAPINAKDEDGNTVEEVTAADIQWSCEEQGVTISQDGTMTVTDSFDIDYNTVKDIIVKGEINGYTMTKTVAVYSYAYYDAISEQSDFDGQFMTLADSAALVWPGENGTSIYKLSEKIRLDRDTQISYKNIWSGSNTAGQYRYLTFKDAENNTVLSLYYCWTDLCISDDVKLSGAVSKDVWSDISIAFEKATGCVTITSGEKLIKTTLDISKFTDITSIILSSAKSCPGPGQRPLGMRDVTVVQ